LSLELFLHSVRDVGVRQDTYKLSRPLHAHEKKRIDFFISHSWSDDAVAKFAAMEAVAASFLQNYGRYPTLWLDKVCIDQDRITDGLKVLPINVTASHRMLVLCGASYASRLWCVWELFTLCAFSSTDHVHTKIRFVPFSSAAGAADRAAETRIVPTTGAAGALSGDPAGNSAAEEALLHFSLAKAHCFDPNEENRLRYGHSFEVLQK
jgi:hypothetical protein